jgi:hypothetical protein
LSVTAAQLTQTAQALSAVDWSQFASLNLSDLNSDAVIGEDVLSVVAVFWPPAALLAEAMVVAVALQPLIAASGIHIAPDADPEVDAQTTVSRGGRNG